jgi:hypothetical protein
MPYNAVEAVCRQAARRAIAFGPPALFQGSSLAAQAEPERRNYTQDGVHARQVTRVVTTIAQQQLMLTVTVPANLASHEVDGGASAIAAHLPTASATVIQCPFWISTRKPTTVGACEQGLAIHDLCHFPSRLVSCRSRRLQRSENFFSFLVPLSEIELFQHDLMRNEFGFGLSDQGWGHFCHKSRRWRSC